MRVPECHPDRAHQAKGLCTQCYLKQYDEARREKRAERNRKDPSDYAPNYRKPTHQPARIPECGHPERKHAAHGMCSPCYTRNGEARATCHPERRLRADGLCGACYGKKRYDEDPETFRQRARDNGTRTRKRNRDELIAAYGSKCACAKCPETNSAFLTLEHVNGDGGQHRKEVGSHTYADLRKRGFPQDGYTLLCMNCNLATRGGKVCPHMS